MPDYQDVSLPTYLQLGGGGMGASGPGFLGMTYAPFNVQNPGTPPENILVPSTVAPRDRDGYTPEGEDRINRRRRLFYSVEDQFMNSRVPHMSGTAEERARFADASKAHRDIYYKGFSLIASKEGKVFELTGESPKLMEDYGAAGMGANQFGRSAIMARRLVEAGVSAVELSLGGWDTHQQTFNAHSTRLQPTLDRAMGTLVKDLVDRRLWDNTVLLWMGDFGRTPRINANNGRDHWPNCWSVVVGGGAIRGGQAFGATDQDGMGIARDPVSVGDVFATVYRALGIDPASQVRDAIGRPFAIAGMNGRPINALVRA
jgi:hypothetical protein